MILTRQALERVITEYSWAVSKTKLKAEDRDTFIKSTTQTLLDYCALFPEGTEFEYRIRKRFGRMELRLQISGEKRNVYEYGLKSKDRDMLRRIHSMMIGSAREMQYVYLRGQNTLYFVTPPVRRSIFLNPVINAVLIGLIAGLLCSLLPDSISGFLIEDVATPVLDIVIKLMAGIMGPVMFLSLVIAISTLDGISEFSRLGTKTFKRFLIIAIIVPLLAMVVGFVAFTLSHGTTSIEFSFGMIMDLLLSVIPLNLAAPFVENNFPQLMVLGLVMGIALLLLNRKESILNDFLMDCRDWINELLRLILKLNPLIPGLTIFRIFARGDFSDFIKGWKYIAAVYVCMFLVLALKIIKVKIRCRKLSMGSVLRSIWPVTKLAFATGSEIASLNKFYETADNELAIEKNLSSLWVPLNQAMLAPIGPIYYVMATFLVAEMTGTPVSVQFLFILFILTAQLALAYPGSIAGITILFNALGLSPDYIGMFSAYGVFIKNAASGFGMTFRLLELTELAYKTDNIHMA